jgi:hypothetical protein
MKLRRSRFLLSLYALFITGSVATVFAVDGVVLIDQNRALAGNVTPGDAPGFPVSLTLPGSYRLSGNLTVPVNTTGIAIQADRVTLDLNGFSIAGDGTGGKAGVRTEDNAGAGLSFRGVTVRNGTITNFLIGVNLSTATVDGSSEVTQIRAIDNHSGGIVVGNNSIVTGNLATGNVFGISTMAHAVVSGNTSTGNTQFGFEVDCPSAIVGNLARGNPTPFAVTNAFTCTFANNTPATP